MSTKCQYRPMSSTVSALRGTQPTPQARHERRHEHDDAYGDVGSVEAREGVEGGAEDVGGVAESEVVEDRELVDLPGDERASEQGGGDDPHPEVPLLAPRERRECQHHRQRAHQEHERAHRRERYVEDVVRPNLAGGQPGLGEHVGGDEGAEQQALRAQEQPHRQLVVRHDPWSSAGARPLRGRPRAGALTVGLGGCDVGHGLFSGRLGGRSPRTRPHATNSGAPSPSAEVTEPFSSAERSPPSAPLPASPDGSASECWSSSVVTPRGHRAVRRPRRRARRGSAVRRRR